MKGENGRGMWLRGLVMVVTVALLFICNVRSGPRDDLTLSISPGGTVGYRDADRNARVSPADPDAALSAGRVPPPPGGYKPQPGPAAALTALQQRGTLAASGGMAGGAWTPLGPAPVSTSNEFPYSTATGRVLSLAYNGSAIYAGTPGGGVWKSTDGGSSWSPIADAFATPSVNALAVDPNNHNVIFAGTGEISEFDDSFRGVGIYKSTDAGTTWRLYGDTIFKDHDISSIVVDPTNSQRVYAGVLRQFYRLNQGVGVSTDSGQTWSVSLPNTDPSCDNTCNNVSGLASDNAGNLYAAVKGDGVYFSSNHATSWTRVSNGLPGSAGNLYKIALAPNTAANSPNAQILYAAVSSASNGSLLGVYRTTNGGTNWTQIGSPTSFPTATVSTFGSDSHLVIGADPADTTGGTVYVGTDDLLKTTTGLGTNPVWTNVSNPSNPPYTNTTKIHVDQYALLWTQGISGETMYIGNDGGVYSTKDGGSTFSALNSGLAITEFYGGDIGPGNNPSLIVGGSQDNGTVKLTGAGWVSALGGDHYYAAIDPTNTNLMYTEDPYGKTIKSTNGFTFGPGLNTWSFATNGMPTPDVYGNIDNAHWQAPLVMDPTTSQTLYSAHEHVWQTTDGMGTWNDISSKVTTSGITALAVSKSAPSTIYIADFWDHRSIDPTDARTHLWATTNGGTTWTSIDGTSCTAANQSPRWCPQEATYVTSLAADPGNSQIVYATVNGVNPGATQGNHVFRSNNGGSTWTDISTTLPNMPFRSIAVDPSTPTTIFAGGAIGVYISYDSGSSWQVLGSGLPNAWVYHMVPSADGSYLFAFTYGRGAWKIPVPSRSATIPVSLTAGWNLVDVPVAAPAYGTGADIAAAINASLGAGDVGVIATYNNGRFSLYVPGYSPDIAVQPSQGIFTLSSHSGTWSATGSLYTSGLTISLRRGWNLVALPYPGNGLSASTIADQIDPMCNPGPCSVEELAQWSGGTYVTYAPGSAGTNFSVPATDGVWIEMQAAATWTPH